jgi:predicted dienelactone hydrolase
LNRVYGFAVDIVNHFEMTADGKKRTTKHARTARLVGRMKDYPYLYSVDIALPGLIQ